MPDRIAAADDGTCHRKLLVETAYHSHHMRAVADDYRGRLLNGENTTVATGQEAGVAFVSSVTGQPRTSGFDAEYWVSHLVSPFRFADAVQTLIKAHHTSGRKAFFIEVGLPPALSGPVRQSLQHKDMPKLSFEYQAPIQRNMQWPAPWLSLL